MTKRKIILLSAIGVLLVAYIIQIANGARSAIGEIVCSSEIDSISIDYNGDNVSILKTNDEWRTKANNYLVGEKSAESVLDLVEKLKILDTVSKNVSSAYLELYGLLTPLKVTATLNGKALKVTNTGKKIAGVKKTLPTILVGKASAVASQTYIMFEGGKEIYLASGNFSTLKDVTESSLRDKKVFAINSNEIFKVRSTSKNEIWTLEKTGENENTEWKIVNSSTNEKNIDSEKAKTWIQNISECLASEWIEKDVTLPFASEAEISISAATKNITITLYKDGDKFIGTSTETPYKFYMANYEANNFMKKLEDLK